MSGESNNSEMRAIRSRLDFSKIPTSIQIPNLIEVQRRSYERFLQMDKLPQEREDNGLQSVFTSVFPITDFRNVSELEFVDFSIGNWECKCGYLKGLNHLRTACTHCGHMVITDPFHPGDVLCNFCGTYNKNTPDFCTKCGDPVGLQLKYDQAECEERGMTYSAPLKVTIRLKIYDKDPETGVKSLRDMKEQEVFFGDIPLMSQNGTFIVNGTERVIVSQLHRSPGVFFETANARTYFLGKIIPYRGSWVEFEYDQKNTLYVRIDRKRKFLGTIFLRALGLRSDEEILKTFYTVDTIQLEGGKLHWTLNEDTTKATHLLGAKPAHAVHSGSDEIAHSGRKVTSSILKALALHFRTYAIYNSNDSDILIIATRGAALPIPNERVFQSPQLRAELDRIGIQGIADLRLRKIGDNRTIGPLLQQTAVPPNSDFFPFVDLNAPRLRFMGARATELSDLTILECIRGLTEIVWKASGEGEFIKRMDPICPLVVELPIGVSVALLKSVVGAHAQVDWDNVGLHIGEMIGRARQVHGFAVRGERGAWNVIAGSHFFQFGRIGRQNRVELGVAIFARSRVHTAHGEVVNHPTLVPAALVVDDEQWIDVSEDIDEGVRIVGIGGQARLGLEDEADRADRRRSTIAPGY